MFEYVVQSTHPGTIQLGGNTASGRAFISELMHQRDGSSNLNYGTYHDRYRRTPDGWKFMERVYEVRYVDTTPLAGSAPSEAGVPISAPMKKNGATTSPNIGPTSARPVNSAPRSPSPTHRFHRYHLGLLTAGWICRMAGPPPIGGQAVRAAMRLACCSTTSASDANSAP